MVEFHSLWRLPAAQRIAQALAEFDTCWHEDPIRMDSLGLLKQYAPVSHAPLLPPRADSAHPLAHPPPPRQPPQGVDLHRADALLQQRSGQLVGAVQEGVQVLVRAFGRA